LIIKLNVLFLLILESYHNKAIWPKEKFPILPLRWEFFYIAVSTSIDLLYAISLSHVSKRKLIKLNT